MTAELIEMVQYRWTHTDSTPKFETQLEQIDASNHVEGPRKTSRLNYIIQLEPVANLPERARVLYRLTDS